MGERTLQVARLSLAIAIVDEAFEETSQTDTYYAFNKNQRSTSMAQRRQDPTSSSETTQTSVKTR
jgi:hypothetical protein